MQRQMGIGDGDGAQQEVVVDADGKGGGLVRIPGGTTNTLRWREFDAYTI